MNNDKLESVKKEQEKNYSFFHACSRGELTKVQEMIETISHGAVQIGADRAVNHSRIEIITYLLSKGISVYFIAISAVECERVDVMEFCLEKGLKPHQIDELFYKACDKQRWRIASFLTNKEISTETLQKVLSKYEFLDPLVVYKITRKLIYSDPKIIEIENKLSKLEQMMVGIRDGMNMLLGADEKGRMSYKSIVDE